MFISGRIRDGSSHIQRANQEESWRKRAVLKKLFPGARSGALSLVTLLPAGKPAAARIGRYKTSLPLLKRVYRAIRVNPVQALRAD